MTWSLDDIEKNLLSEPVAVLAIAPEAVEGAVNRVEETLGPSWIVTNVSGKGISPAMHVISLGLRLEALDSMHDLEPLLERVRRNEDGAVAELTALWMLRRIDPSASVQLDPPVGGKNADLRVVRSDGTGVTVAVTSPQTSLEEKRLRETQERLTNALEGSGHPFTLDVVLRREPASSELDLLCERLPEFTKLEGQQRATLTGDLGWLILNLTAVGTWLGCHAPEMRETPMIGLVMFQGGGPNQGPLYQVSVQLPFAEGRAERFLRDKAQQLPEDEPGLLMIQVSSSPNSLNAWASLIGQRLDSIGESRISGVCLFSGEVMPAANGYVYQPRARLVANPHATFRLPEWMTSGVSEIGREYDRLATTGDLQAPGCISKSRATD